MILALRCNLDLLLENLEKDGHDLCVLIKEVRDHILSEVADGEAGGLADHLLRVLKTANNDVSEQFNVVLNRVKECV